MDWLPDFKKIAEQEYRLETLKAERFTGNIEIHLDSGIVKLVKVQNVLRSI